MTLALLADLAWWAMLWIAAVLIGAFALWATCCVYDWRADRRDEPPAPRTLTGDLDRIWQLPAVEPNRTVK